MQPLFTVAPYLSPKEIWSTIKVMVLRKSHFDIYMPTTDRGLITQSTAAKALIPIINHKYRLLDQIAE